MPEMASELLTSGSAAAGRGQLRCRRRSVVVAKVGRWLAFCTYAGIGRHGGGAELTTTHKIVDTRTNRGNFN